MNNIDYNSFENIKILNKFKQENKDKSRVNFQKIKFLKNKINEVNKENENINNRINKIKNIYKRKKNINVCFKCFEIYTHSKHKCIDNHNYRSYNCINYEYDKELSNLNYDLYCNDNYLYKLNCEIKECIDNELHYRKILDEVNELLRNLCKSCQKCYKKNLVLESCGCKYDHQYCENCINEIDNCVVCEQILNLEACPICLSSKKDLITVSCGNNHKLCRKCFKMIIEYNPKCPFCRVNI